MDKAVGQAFLDAVTPAAVAATAGAIRELEGQHQARLAGQRLALERAEYEAERAERQFDACEPENRLVARTLERKLEEALAAVEREQRAMAAIERTRPVPLTDAERESLGEITRNLPRLWNAKTTTQRDRKQLLRSLVNEVVVTIEREQHRADVEIFWEGGASTELQVRLNRYEGPRRLPEDTTISSAGSRRTTLTIRSPRSSTFKDDAPGKACHSPARACEAPDSAPGSQPRHHRTPTASLSRSTAPPTSSACRTSRSAAGCATGCSQASRQPRDHRGGSASPTRSAPGSCPTSRTGLCRSPRQPNDSASRDRPCCIRSNEASAERSKSPKADEKAFESRFPTKSLDCLPKRDGEEAV